MIFGSGPFAGLLAQELRARGEEAQVVVDTDALVARVRERADGGTIVVAHDERRGKLPLRELLKARFRGTAVESAEEFYERLTGKIAIEALTPTSVIFSAGVRERLWHERLSRAMSFVLSAVALVLLAPLFVLLGVAIRLESPGPAFFVQERVGLRGRRFRLVKFRTMRPDDGSASEWEKENGHRITSLGRFLRRFRIDEWPQFVNVLRGDMNVVGPRPHPVTSYPMVATVARNICERGDEIPYYSIRSIVRPGITGWAQVRYGYANGVEEEIEKLRYDLYYIKHRSLALDARILLRTLGVVLSGHDARRAFPRGVAPHPFPRGVR